MSKRIQTLFERFLKDNPHPKTELIYNSPFELLLAVILSAQATDVSVNKATQPLFRVANTPEQCLALGFDGLSAYLKTLNYYPTKTRHILRSCEILIQQHQSTVPTTRAALEALPGVGRKTANVLLNTLFGEASIAVDTHILRVANRLQLSQGKTPLAVERDLIKTIPSHFQKQAHHWLVLHGRYVCKARKPLCEACFLHDLCPSSEFS